MENTRQIKKRLRAIASMEKLGISEIAEKTQYSRIQVGASLDPEKKVLSKKFLERFFKAFPKVDKEWVLEGISSTPSEESTAGQLGLLSSESQLALMKNENKMLRDQLDRMNSLVEEYKRLIDRAVQIYPDLPGKLIDPFAALLGVDNTLVMSNSQKGTLKGAFAY